MKSTFGLAMACALGLAISTSTIAQAQGQHHKKGGVVVKKHSGHGHHHSNKGRNIAAGVAASVIGAIILNEAAKASSGSGHSCQSLERRCDDGQDWACRKLDRSNC